VSVLKYFRAGVLRGSGSFTDARRLKRQMTFGSIAKDHYVLTNYLVDGF
jgi:hypothetical protein